MHKIAVYRAKNLIEKIVGLIGRKEPFPLALQTRFGIHTFGLRFPIDVLILSDTCEVKSLKENLRPCRVYLWNPKYNTVIELPVGTIKNYKIVRGERIQIELSSSISGSF